ncbi:MAG: MlaE family lipid ABC transporter permease subunit [Nitrospirota bacterium]
MNFIAKIGAWFIGILNEMGKMAIFLGHAFHVMVMPPYKIRWILKRIRFLGTKSISIILLTGAFTGMVLGLQLFYTLRKFSSEALLGPAVALSLVRELGPVLSALMITGRAGSSLTAEIGMMKITEQLDAFYSMALNPVRYFIAPTIIAGIIVFPLLSAIFNVIGIYGGYVVGVKLLSLSSGTYFSEMQTLVEMQDILIGIYKSLSFGVLVTWVCSYKGFYAGHGAEGVSRATTEAVVMSSVLILISDYFIGSLFV